MRVKPAASSVETTTLQRAYASLDARVMAARAIRMDVPEMAERYRRQAVRAEQDVPMAALIEVYAVAGAEALLWVLLDGPRALEELGSAGAPK